jgi:hypothetical protein
MHGLLIWDSAHKRTWTWTFSKLRTWTCTACSRKKQLVALYRIWLQQSSIHTHTLPMPTLLSLSCTQVLWFFSESNSPSPRVWFYATMSTVYLTVDCTVSDCNRVTYTSLPSPFSLSSLSLTLRSFVFFHNSTPPVVVSVFTKPYGYSVSDYSRSVYTPTPSPFSHSSLSCVIRFLGFCTSKRLTTTPTPSHFLSLVLSFCVYNKQKTKRKRGLVKRFGWVRAWKSRRGGREGGPVGENGGNGGNEEVGRRSEWKGQPRPKWNGMETPHSRICI